MTIASQTTSIIAQGNGATVTFPFPFLIPYQDDGETPAINVFLNTAGIITQLAYPTAFSVSGIGNPSGGSVTLLGALATTPIPAGTYIFIERAQAYVQPFAVNNLNFYPHTVEQSADWDVGMTQQLVTDLAGAITVPPGDVGGEDMVLPSAQIRAGRLLGFDASGNVVTLPAAPVPIFPTSVTGWDSAANYGAKGDGVTDDSAALNNWLAASSTNKVLPPAPGGFYLINKPLLHVNAFNGLPAVNIYFGALIKAGPLFPATTYGATFQSYNTNTYNFTFDGGLNGITTNYAWGGLSNGNGANGFGGWRCKHYSPHIYHCSARLFGFEAGGDSALIECDLEQWFSNDTAFTTQANFTADGIHNTVHDNRVIGGTIHSCGIPFHGMGFNANTNQGSGTTWIIGTHIYNGAFSPATTFTNPTGVQLEAGSSGHFFANCYFDNSLFLAYSSAFKILGINFQSVNSGSTFNPDVWLQMFCDNKTYPFQNQLIGLSVQGAQDTSTAIMDMYPSPTVPVASVSGDGTHVTYVISVAAWTAQFNDAGPKINAYYTFAGFSTSGFNVVQVQPSSVSTSGGNYLVTVANTTTGATSTGTVSAVWLGSYANLLNYTIIQQASLNLDSGRIHVAPVVNSVTQPYHAVEFSPLQDIIIIYDVDGTATPITEVYDGNGNVTLNANTLSLTPLTGQSVLASTFFKEISPATNLVASTTHTIVGGTQMTQQTSVFATVANSGDAGTLPVLNPGQHADVYNNGANPMAVFPHTSSGNIDGAGAGASVTLTNAKRCRFTCVSTNVIISAQLGAPSA